MTFSVAIGREFEQKYVDILKVKMCRWKGQVNDSSQFPKSQIRGRGDKGIDMRGRIHGEKFAGQCKAWRKNKIGPAVIRDMIGALANEPWFTIGVVVGLSKDTFTSGAVKAAEKAGIIITDSDHLYDDLSVVAGPAVIREMIGALANEPWFTIGMVVGLSKDTFTSGL
ncbi:15653_t:CDS:2 [Funneliformis mosseae]|uniref:15653_t:CDS:1 n=1 Tax=Funneliformis mosseae TaxID=27381 RepID=A0A9N9CK05_FUNMO|nr:15653_t:CDS:2 [Funneliformis mosseae]